MRALRLLAGVLIGAYFFLLTREALDGWFTPDDTMNLYRAWSFPLGWLVRANLLFWETSVFYRPLPAAWYRAMYALVGLHPLLFHATAMIVLAGNIFLTYAVARRLSDSREVGALAALFGCYHSSFAPIYFDTGFIYDVFCYFFYFAAMLMYIRTRQAGRPMFGWPLAAVAVLYICALNSKEMPVTLPLMLAAYEWLYQKPRSRAGKELAILGGITLLFLIGRATGADSLAKLPTYDLSFTWQRFIATNRQFLGNLAFSYNPAGTAVTLLVWAGLGAAAWLSKSRVLQFAWLFLMLTVLPMSFAPPRGAPQYYVTLFGWALYAAAALDGVSRRMLRVPQRAAIVFGAAILFLYPFYRIKGWDVDTVRSEGPLMHHISSQLLRLHPRMAPGSKLLFLNDPIDPAWQNMIFIVHLIYGDDSIQVDRLKQMPARPSDDVLAGYNAVFDYRGGRFVELKRPWRVEVPGPTIILSPEGPDVYHDNWTRVDPRHAAKPGEMLIARAIGLGATEPAVPPDKPFPPDPYAKVLARVEVRVNGERAESGLLFAWPNEVGMYRVDFRVPKGAAVGAARVEILADGVSGAAAEIPVR